MDKRTFRIIESKKILLAYVLFCLVLSKTSKSLILSQFVLNTREIIEKLRIQKQKKYKPNFTNNFSVKRKE